MTEDLTVYVRTDGDDAADGLSEKTAKATLQAALDSLAMYDNRGQTVVIDVGPGTFAGCVISSHTTSLDQSLTIQGAGEETVIGPIRENYYSLAIYHHILVSLIDVCFSSSLYIVESSDVLFAGDIVFAPEIDGLNLLYVRKRGNVTVAADTLTVRKTNHAPNSLAYAWDAGSTVSFRTGGVTFEDGVSFGIGVLRAGPGASIHTDYPFQGAPEGRKYVVSGGGSLDCGNNSPDTYLPGDQPGVVYPYGLAGTAGAAQAWALTGSTQGALAAGHNIGSVTKTGTGVYVITFSRPFPHVNYAPVVSIVQTVRSDRSIVVKDLTVNGLTVTTFKGEEPDDIVFALAIFA